MEHVALGIVGACLLTSGLFVVAGRQLVRAVLWLGVTLASTAVLFVMLAAPFLAGIQVLLYVGGVMTLMIFGVMLTRHEAGAQETAAAGAKVRAAIVSLAAFAVLTAAVIMSGDLTRPFQEPVTTAALGAAIFGEWALAFEVLSVLLLAAMVGAIVLARRRDHGEGANT